MDRRVVTPVWQKCSKSIIIYKMKEDVREVEPLAKERVVQQVQPGISVSRSTSDSAERELGLSWEPSSLKVC